MPPIPKYGTQDQAMRSKAPRLTLADLIRQGTSPSSATNKSTGKSHQPKVNRPSSKRGKRKGK